ncbi:inositol monophosphatase family protein [Advenella mimigardefordensis]|uniref:Inositol-1-monophosphatase n=1 Tax=Advenella mimigardefordensis (strain DSM 17166 / LMG 22922 / DPN7) TaxID=1247726 RepID=W0P9E5_ADVMD|nr:inositol monophosphatase family protein [Advenella mimigardefordensis]AHG63336.1 inositol-1-monophosphatase [Advenella mimigardefordensis DPN7]
MHPMLTIAVRAARRAGAIINRGSLDLDKVQIARKGPNDYVTEIDRNAEQAVIEVLRDAYPDHAFLGEESGHIPGPKDKENEVPEYQWVIDPLDGTTNFVHGFPNYAVSIALLHKGVVTQAVVYDPARNEMFTATRGGGAFLNDRRVRVGSRTRFSDALIAGRFPSVSGSTRTGAERFYGLVDDCSGFRRLGATVLELAYVATGRFDGYCGVHLKPWDVAAGSLLILEAGGLIADFDGEQTWQQTGNVLAASPKIFTQMLISLKQ